MPDTLVQRLERDLREALKNRKTAELRTLRALKSALQTKELEAGRGSLKESDAIAVLQKQARQRKDSIEQFERAGRTDLVDKESEELAIIEAYLPEEMSESEINEIIEEAIGSTGATSRADMGKVMGAVMPAVRGRADGNRVRELVTMRLSQ
jgi:hypothetical protein